MTARAMSAGRNLTSPHRNCIQRPKTTICALVTTVNLKKKSRIHYRYDSLKRNIDNLIT